MHNENDASKHPHKRAVHVEKAVRIGTTYNVVNEIRRHPQLYKAFPSAPTLPSRRAKLRRFENILKTNILKYAEERHMTH